MYVLGWGAPILVDIALLREESPEPSDLHINRSWTSIAGGPWIILSSITEV